MKKVAKQPIGIIDIGSNSVRFVVYEPPYIGEFPVFNEKVQCGLGRDLGKTGKLYKGGIDCTLDALQGFKAIAAAMGVRKLHVVGTAALRDATDGKTFAARIHKATGFKVKIISGEEEARLAALGVLSFYPRAAGIVGDLGGGSLELARIGGGKVQSVISLPLGTLRIMSQKRKQDYIAEYLSALPREMIGRKKFFAVGGTWRILGHVHRLQKKKAGKTPERYECDAGEFARFARKLARKSKTTLVKKYHVESKRAELLPHAARLLADLLDVLEAETIVISKTSLRDGLLYDLMHKK